VKLVALRAPASPSGGYNGSIYTLAYDAANDVPKGASFQAAARQQFNVTFMRAR
jgi:hypothetical protein